MPKPNDDDKVHIIVTQRPNKVFAICNDRIHSANWKTAESDRLTNVLGNHGLLNAAMLFWSGAEAFTTTFAELEKFSQGWGAWDSED